MYMTLFGTFALTSMMLLTSPALGQSSSVPDSGATKAAAETQQPTEVQSDVAALKAENAAVREQLRRMEATQKALLEQVERLQQRLDNPPAASAQRIGQPDQAAPAVAQAKEADAPDTLAQPAPQPVKKDDDRYKDGIIIWETPEGAKIPFLLRFNNNTQIRYLNTLSSNDTFTDHLGVVREVHNRNDITINRSMFILGGYMFDKRLKYGLTVWTSAGAASIIVAGSIGWQFNKALTITGGYNGVPGSRSLVNTFPYFTASDRSMADNFFRPGFTQGVWANGEPVKGLNYMVFVGNGLNTLNISATKIDTKLLYSGSVWWEPFGDFAPQGKTRNMYDDYFASKKVRVRLGTAFTRSPEDRFSNLDVSNPENTALYNSDGVLTFATGAFAPGVTLDKATYRMWAIDGGVKWNGLAVNGQYFFRWLNDFVANGPIPVSSTFDHGFELSASHFVIPKKLLLYARGSQVFGEFGNSSEYAGGIKWHVLPTERFWVNAELMRVNRSPYSGAFTPYTAGMNGWVPMLQSILAF